MEQKELNTNEIGGKNDIQNSEMFSAISSPNLA